jgi:hypothetical protein
MAAPCHHPHDLVVDGGWSAFGWSTDSPRG